MPADLHCHSLFSVDGWATPEELAESMAAAGIGTLALTDHNTVEGLARCRSRAVELGLRFINGAEFDAMWRGAEHHFVAFGFDPDHPALCGLCRRQFAQYEVNFARFLPILERRYGVTRADLVAGLPGRYRSHPAPVINKWYARGFLLSRGVFADEKASLKVMSDVAAEAEQGTNRPWDWVGVEEVRDTVHAAGGILLLAHPAGYRRGNLRAQLDLIEGLLGLGLDGFELYHPSNMLEPHFDELVAAAHRLGCAVSGGSDSHRDETRTVQAPRGFQVPDWVIETIDRAQRSRSKEIRSRIPI